MISFNHSGSEKRAYRFPSGNKLVDAREGGGWLYGCIVTLYLQIQHLSKMTQKFVYSIFSCTQSIFKQPEDSFIKIGSPKIDFCFEVFKLLKNHVLSYLTGATQHKDRNLLKIRATFIASLMKKTYLAVHLTSQWVDLLCKFVGRQESCGRNIKIFSASWRYKKASLFLLAYDRYE